MNINTLKRYLGKTGLALIAAAAALALAPIAASAHCDTMDGPTAADGIKALETGNLNYALKWVRPEHETELAAVFDLSMKVRELGPEAKELAGRYFLENLVRLHRAGEGAPFTGLKPSGTPIDERALAADKSIATGDLSPLAELIEEDRLPELAERFAQVMALKNFDVNDLEAGREYIEAYVRFFKFAEGEEDEAHGRAHAAEAHE